MKLETLKKAEEFKQGHLNLVQYFLKKGCKFQVIDLETDKRTVSFNYEEIKSLIDNEFGTETHLWIIKGDKLISRVHVIPYNDGLDTIADYTVSKEMETWSDKFEKTMEQLN